jgi:hypothetical protein
MARLCLYCFADYQFGNVGVDENMMAPAHAVKTKAKRFGAAYRFGETYVL